MKIKLKNMTFLAFVLGTLPMKYAVAATPGDYDGDGKADLALVDEDPPEDKTTVFVRKSSSNRGGELKYTFFPYGDFVVSRRISGDAKTYPGIVHKPSTAGAPLTWYWKTPSGAQESFQYGVLGDEPVPGDLDCDGTTDYVVVRDGTSDFWPGFKLWYAMLSSNPGVVHRQVFGLANDRFKSQDIDGDGCDEIVALRNDFTFYSKPFFAGEEQTTAVQWGLGNDKFLWPADMDGDNIPNYAITRSDGTNSTLFVRTPAGAATVSGAGKSSSIPLIGNFFGSNTAAWFDRISKKAAQFQVRKLDQSLSTVKFGNKNRGVLRPDGSYVAEGRTGTF